MAREDSDLLGDDLAAFIEGSDDILAAAGEETIESVTELPSDEWETQTDDGLPSDNLAVDVYETKDRLIVKARTAGIAGKDLDIKVSDGILTISGVLQSDSDEDITDWHIQECYWGEFSRAIALPVPVKEDGVKASVRHGILVISFEKEKIAEPTVIQVEDQ
jgi:HSP20 family protein